MRDNYRMIYSSSPDRGLEVLLLIFDKIKEQVPEANLHIYYGFENFRNKEYVAKLMMEINKRPGIFYHGRVGQDELAKAFMESSIFSYTCTFQETFCISCLEAMAGGCVVVSSDYWGLHDTVGEGGILLPMSDPKDAYTSEYQDRYVEECVKLMKDESYRKEWQLKGFERVKRFTWENVAKQWHLYFQQGIWNEIQ